MVSDEQESLKRELYERANAELEKEFTAPHVFSLIVFPGYSWTFNRTVWRVYLKDDQPYLKKSVWLFDDDLIPGKILHTSVPTFDIKEGQLDQAKYDRLMDKGSKIEIPFLNFDGTGPILDAGFSRLSFISQSEGCSVNIFLTFGYVGTAWEAFTNWTIEFQEFLDSSPIVKK